MWKSHEFFSYFMFLLTLRVHRFYFSSYHFFIVHAFSLSPYKKARSSFALLSSIENLLQSLRMTTF